MCISSSSNSSRSEQSCDSLGVVNWMAPLLHTESKIPGIPGPLVLYVAVSSLKWASMLCDQVVTRNTLKLHHIRELSLEVQRSRSWLIHTLFTTKCSRPLFCRYFTSDHAAAHFAPVLGYQFAWVHLINRMHGKIHRRVTLRLFFYYLSWDSI